MDSLVTSANVGYILPFGGVKVIIASLDAHRSNVDVQRIGCTMLGLITKWRDDDLVTEIVNAGPAEAVIAAMQSNPWDAQIQLSACKALYRLAYNSSKRAQMLEAAAFIAYKGNLDVQKIDCKILGGLADKVSMEREDLVTESLEEGGAIDAVIAAMKDHVTCRMRCRACLGDTDAPVNLQEVRKIRKIRLPTNTSEIMINLSPY